VSAVQEALDTGPSAHPSGRGGGGRALRHGAHAFFSGRAGRLVVLAAVLGIWEWWTRSSVDGLVPPVTKIVSALWDMLDDGTLLSALGQSNAALAIGLVLAIVGGVLLGMATGRYRWIDLAAAPYLHLAMVIPMVALVPVVVVFMGIGLPARVAVVVLFALPDITINVRSGVLSVERALLEMAGAYGASEARLWRFVVLPASFPAIMTGIRVGIGRAVMGMVVVELTLVVTGLGGLILEALGSFEAASMFAVIVAIAAEALLLTAIATRAERAVRLRMGSDA
jgi:ABC-type nitrate/sulfonate/bicarbonate transport system permease component